MLMRLFFVKVASATLAMTRQLTRPILDSFQLTAFECFENLLLFWIKFAHRIHQRTVWTPCGSE